MKKTIKVDDLKKEIENLVNMAFNYLDNDNEKMYDYCYNKALCYVSLIHNMCIDFKKSSYKKEYDDIDNWFDEITKSAIYK